MIVYRIDYNIERRMPYPQEDESVYFKDLKAANEFFDDYALDMRRNMGDWMVLFEVEVDVRDGEYFINDEKELRFLSLADPL